ncbi:MAG: hypothetical protein JJU05_05130 [Verrucomicrobia bacterium]|nr:hypothetical protein [Verrucomicrobiota bacterium]MCH8525795.1 hypothetical protein [Kiritimatiellia bacterium]
MFLSRARILLLTVSVFAGMTSAQPLQQAAVVPDADMILSVNMAELSQSAFMKALEAQQSPQVKALRTQQQERVQAAMGLKEEDILGYMLSFRLPEDLFKTDFDPGPETLENLQFVLAVEVGRALTLDDLKKGIELLQEDTPGNAKVETVELGGQSALQLNPQIEDADTPIEKAFVSVSDDGKIVLLTLNEASLTSAHARLSGGQTAAPGAGLAPALQALEGNQIRMALVLPAAARQTLAGTVQQMSAADPMMGMFAAPFAGLSSITFSGNAAETMAMALNIDLGNDMAAQQLAAMARNFGPGIGGAAGPFVRKITTEAVGTVLRLSGILSPEDMRPLTMEMDLDGLE